MKRMKKYLALALTAVLVCQVPSVNSFASDLSGETTQKTAEVRENQTASGNESIVEETEEENEETTEETEEENEEATEETEEENEEATEETEETVEDGADMAGSGNELPEEENKEFTEKKDLPSQLGWSEDFPGYMEFMVNTGKDWVQYYFYIFENGKLLTVQSTNIGFGYNGSTYTWNVSDLMKAPAEYSYRIAVVPDDSEMIYETDFYTQEGYEKLVSEGYELLTDFSSVYKYTQTKKLDVPTNIKISEKNPTVLVWDPVANADFYNIRILNGPVNDKEEILDWKWSHYPSINISDPYYIDKTCYVTIRAGLDDIELYGYSDWSEPVKVTFGEALKQLEGDYKNISNLKWNSKQVGRIEFEINDNRPSYTVLEVWRDSEEYSYSTYYLDDLSWYAGGKVTIDISNAFDRKGTYKVKVYTLWGEEYSYDVIEGWFEEANIWGWGNLSAVIPKDVVYSVAESEVYNYNPTKELQKVTGITWSKTNFGKVSWNSVPDAYQYQVELYQYNEDGWWSYVRGFRKKAKSNSINFASYMTDATARYGVKIRAYPADISTCLASEWTECIEYDNMESLGTIKEVEDTLNSVISIKEETQKKIDQYSSLTEKEKEEVRQEVASSVDALKESFAKDKITNLQAAMQNSDSVLSKIENLEKNYEITNHVSTSVKVASDVGFEENDISLIGASLNASAGSTIKFQVEKATKDDCIVPDIYKNAVKFSLDLLKGDAKVAGLEVPVTITMPIPSNIQDVSKLAILHYDTKGGYDVIYPRVSGNKMTFTITHFSTFAFVEDNSEPEDNNGNEGNNGNVIKPIVVKPTNQATKVSTSAVTSAATSPKSSLEQKIENDKAIKVNVLTGANRLFLYDYLASIQISDKDILDVSVYNTDQGYVNGFLDTVKNKLSAESSTAALYIGGWTYINKEMAEAVQASNKEIKLIFLQEGTYYLVTIPAGADVTSCLDENGYAGPLYIASKVGVTKQLEK